MHSAANHLRSVARYRQRRSISNRLQVWRRRCDAARTEHLARDRLRSLASQRGRREARDLTAAAFRALRNAAASTKRGKLRLESVRRAARGAVVRIKRGAEKQALECWRRMVVQQNMIASTRLKELVAAKEAQICAQLKFSQTQIAGAALFRCTLFRRHCLIRKYLRRWYRVAKMIAAINSASRERRTIAGQLFRHLWVINKKRYTIAGFR